jgi:hypothetical protein
MAAAVSDGSNGFLVLAGGRPFPGMAYYNSEMIIQLARFAAIGYNSGTHPTGAN